MRKFVVTTALVLVLAGRAYAQGHHGGGGVAAHGGGGGLGPGFSALRGPRMGNRGPTGNVYNRAPTNMNTYRNNGGNYNRFSQRNQRELYNRYEGEKGNRFENREGKGQNQNFDHRGIVRGNFFEHGRHFGFRRFFNGQWVFLTAGDSCSAWAWVNVAPGVWAWRPVDICIG